MATVRFRGKWLCEECLALESKKSVKKKSKPIKQRPATRKVAKAKSAVTKPAKPKFYNRGEAFIVDSEPLGHHLRAWITRWHIDRPHNTSGVYGQTKEEYFFGPIQYLHEQTGINLRRISGINNGEFHQVPLSQADALLTAIGENWRLSPEIGDVVVKQNPTWSPEYWAAYMRDRGCF